MGKSICVIDTSSHRAPTTNEAIVVLAATEFHDSIQLICYSGSIVVSSNLKPGPGAGDRHGAFVRAQDRLRSNL